MGPSPQASVLTMLERAELGARERRLEASSRAEGIVAQGRDRASRILAQREARVSAALEDLRRRSEGDADRIIRSLEQAAAQRERSGAASAADEDRFAAAVELVVCAVLGEEPPRVDADSGVSAVAVSAAREDDR